MKTILRAGALLLGLGLVACSQSGFNANLQVTPQPVAGVDWAKYKTWSFGRQGEYVKTGIDVLDDPQFRKGVSDHTIQEMQSIGYGHVDQDADMLLMFHVMVEQRFDEVKVNPAYQDYDMNWAHMHSDDTWEEGTLLMFMIDAKTGSQVWSSSAQAELAKDASFDTRLQRFKHVVTEMIEDFPIRAVK